MGDVKAFPVLAGPLVEGLFAECIGSIKASLDCCRFWRSTEMSLEEHIASTYVIARDEVNNVLEITQHHSEASMRQKQWLARMRCERFLSDTEDVSLTPESPSKDMEVFARSLTKFLSDLHVIMNEDTPKPMREYLVYGKEGPPNRKREDGAADGEGVSKRSRRSGKSGNKASERRTRLLERSGGQFDPSGVRKRGKDSGVGEKASGVSKDDPSLEGEAGMGEGRGDSGGRDSGSSPEDHSV